MQIRTFEYKVCLNDADITHGATSSTQKMCITGMMLLLLLHAPTQGQYDDTINFNNSGA